MSDFAIGDVVCDANNHDRVGVVWEILEGEGKVVVDLFDDDTRRLIQEEWDMTSTFNYSVYFGARGG